MAILSDLTRAMIDYYKGDTKRINHFLKVYAYAQSIGEQEGLDAYTQCVLEVAALTHDIGIKISEQKYNSSTGAYQQIEGPPIARQLLGKLAFELSLIDRVCYLISKHHTYTDIDGLDYQILVEADFLVNLDEDSSDLASIISVRDKIFKTNTGKSYLEKLFL